MKRAIVLSLLAVAGFFPSANLYAENQPHWSNIDSDVQDKLFSGKWDICEVAKSLAAKEPQNATEAMTKLSVMLRAGMDDQAVQTVKQLKKFVGEMNENSLAGLCYDCAYRDYGMKLAMAVAETFPEICKYKMDMWAIHFTKAGWSHERIDNWMAEREKQAEHPQFKDDIPEEFGDLRYCNMSYWEATCAWRIERMDYLVSVGKGENFADQIKLEIEKNPSDIKNMLCYMHLLTRLPSNSPQRRNIGKLVDIYKPKTALEANTVANYLMAARYYREALKLNMQAIEMPLTEKEKTFFSTYNPEYIFDRHVKDEIKIRILQQIAECNIKLGNMAEAEKYVRQEDELRRKNSVPQDFYYDGAIHQTAYGKAVGEKLLQQEKSGKGLDKQFWKNYLCYSYGSGDIARQELAFRKMLEILKPEPPRTENGCGARGFMVVEYFHFLRRQHREKDAFALLTNELKTTGPNCESSDSILEFTLYEVWQNNMPLDEAVAWKWLETRDRWHYEDKSLLLALFRKLQPEGKESPERPGDYIEKKTPPNPALQAAFDRAKKMTEGKDFAMSIILADAICEFGYPRLGRPLLHDVMDNSKHSSQRASAAYRLYSSYLASKNLENAEAYLFFREPGDFAAYQRLIFRATELRDQSMAMRLWPKLANCNLRQTKLIQSMADATLSGELIKYYEEITKKLPDSSAPAEAMKIIYRKQ